MKEKTIRYTNVNQQIESLKAQDLIISDEEYAKECLSLFGYSNLIKGYREPYTILSDGKKTFRSGVSFEQICSLYMLDKNLRNAVMAAMLDLEEHIKEAAADVVAVSFGVHHDRYLSHSLQQEINRHCSAFPPDVTYLGQTLNMNIELAVFVYVSDKSKKFHTDKHCSGIQNAKRIELSEAQKLGYDPCKRCC